MGAHSAEVVSTQSRFPAQAIKRTLTQVIIPTAIALGLVVPQIVQAILDGYGEAMPQELRLWLLGVAAGVVATAGVLAKIMAIPGVDSWLKGLGLGAQPK